MPTEQPEVAIATRIVSELGAPWALGTNVFTGPVRAPRGAIPEKAIFVLGTGGPAPQPYMGGAEGGSFGQPTVQVRIRGDKGEYDNTRALASQVWDAVNKASLEGYVACLPMQATPVYLGVDSTDHHEFSVNVQLWISA